MPHPYVGAVRRQDRMVHLTETINDERRGVHWQAIRELVPGTTTIRAGARPTPSLAKDI
jgi:hypothetical protein